jgi:hypothetical protein
VTIYPVDSFFVQLFAALVHGLNGLCAQLIATQGKAEFVSSDLEQGFDVAFNVV